MGRKADPRGKDRPRTIVLAGDVAEIAQKLADNGTLSRTLSELLRHNYGFGDEIEEKKRELNAILDERARLLEKAEETSAAIDILEQVRLENETTAKPRLENNIKILQKRQERLTRELQRAFDSITISRKQKQLDETNQMLSAALLELEGMS